MKILLLGVGNIRNSMIHHVEVVAGLPYNDIPFRQFWGDTAVVERNGKTEMVPLIAEYPACSDNFSWLDEPLVQEGIASTGTVGGAKAYLLDSRRLKDFVIKRLKNKPACLLCTSITCEPCGLRRRRLKERGLI